MNCYNSKIKRGILVGLFSAAVLLSGAGVTGSLSQVSADSSTSSPSVEMPKEGSQIGASAVRTQDDVKSGTANVNGESYSTLTEAVSKATDGNTITISGRMSDKNTIGITKKVNIKGTSGATIAAGLQFNNGAAGSTISGIHFDNTGETAKQIQLWIACENVSVSNNTFELNPGNANGQYNSVWLTGNADNIRISGNKFTIYSPTNGRSWTGINIVGNVKHKLDNIEITNNELTCPGGTSESGNRNLIVAIGNVPVGTTAYGVGSLKIENNKVNDYTTTRSISNVHAIIAGNVENLQIANNKLDGYVGLRTTNYQGGQSPLGSVSFTKNVVDATHGVMFGKNALPGNGIEISDNTVGPNTDLIKPGADAASIIFKFSDGITKDDIRVIPKGTNVISVPSAQRKGYQFGGWYNESGQKVAVNGNQLNLSQFKNSKAEEGIDEVLTASWIPGMTVPPITNSPEVTAPTTSTTPTTSTSPNTETEKPTTSKNPVPRRAIKMGGYLYLTKGTSLYRSADFSNGNRLSKFTKQSRTKRPVFKVLAHAFSKAGNFRYKVVDQNQGSKTYKKTGYVTGASGYSSNLYYTTMPQSKRIQVINAKGIYQYKNANLTNRRDRIAKGKTLRIKKVTTGNATRYQLANGNYISANKQLVIWK
ncbi:hypothetical protein KTE19_06520 [Lentilactobacillus sp. IMAU92037]|uniref:DUF5776 domain-containing protein n=2 Tax=Lentilactobacillus dabitei TaxID=2831523 RepID=UPI001C2BA37F|nr:DUF5776 domain-containing protein [Lentilactobacillus dabitei]MBV0930367.1 hypothetical protein [Lentilactobacillus dabitei]